MEGWSEYLIVKFTSVKKVKPKRFQNRSRHPNYFLHWERRLNRDGLHSRDRTNPPPQKKIFYPDYFLLLAPAPPCLYLCGFGFDPCFKTVQTLLHRCLKSTVYFRRPSKVFHFQLAHHARSVPLGNRNNVLLIRAS